MAKLTLNTIGSRYGSIDALNDNFDAIEQAIENTLSRDGISPNAMEADLDMNSNDILNVRRVNTSQLVLNGQSVYPNTVVTPAPAFTAYEFVATAGQTTFSVAPNTLTTTNRFIVSINGLELPSSEVSYSGTNVILPATTLNDEVFIKVFSSEVSGAVQNANSVTYTPAGTGVANTTVQSKLRETISAFDFLTPAQIADVQARTGLFDLTVPLQAFFDACKGKRGYMPAGTYTKSGEIVLDPVNSYCIEGAGWSSEFSDQGTTIRDTTNSNGLFIYYNNANYVGGPVGGGFPNSDNRVRISRLAFKGPNSLTMLPGTRTLSIEGVNTTQLTGSGIWCYWVNQLDLEDVWISGYPADGVYMYRSFSSNFRNVLIVQNNHNGIWMYQTANAVEFSNVRTLGNGRVPYPLPLYGININNEAAGGRGFGARIGGGTDVSYSGKGGYSYKRSDSTLTNIVVSGGTATVNAPGHKFKVGDLVAVNGGYVEEVLAGSFVVGVPYTITFVGTTNFVAIGAASNTVGVTFTATGIGSGSGAASRNDVPINTLYSTPVLTAATNSFTYATTAPARTYNNSFLTVHPWAGGVGLRFAESTVMDIYCEDTSGPGVFIDKRSTGFDLGGYFQNSPVIIDADATFKPSGLVRPLTLSGPESVLYVADPVGITILPFAADSGGGISYLGGLPIPNSTATGSFFSGGYTGRGTRTGNDNVRNWASGVGALYNVTTDTVADGIQNSAFGYFAGNANTDGLNNAYFGYLTGSSNKTGDQNTLIGSRAGWAATNLQATCSLGYNSLSNVTSTDNDVMIGVGAGQKNTAAVSTGLNVGIGSNVLRVDGTQDHNGCVVIGFQTAVMTSAAVSNFIGLGRDVQTDTRVASNRTIIGNSNTSTAFIYGAVVLGLATTASALPAASVTLRGARATVTDAVAATFNTILVGGGANIVPVFCDGTNWRIG